MGCVTKCVLLVAITAFIQVTPVAQATSEPLSTSSACEKLLGGGTISKDLTRALVRAAHRSELLSSILGDMPMLDRIVNPRVTAYFLIETPTEATLSMAVERAHALGIVASPDDSYADLGVSFVKVTGTVDQFMELTEREYEYTDALWVGRTRSRTIAEQYYTPRVEAPEIDQRVEQLISAGSPRLRVFVTVNNNVSKEIRRRMAVASRAGAAQSVLSELQKSLIDEAYEPLIAELEQAQATGHSVNYALIPIQGGMLAVNASAEVIDRIIRHPVVGKVNGNKEPAPRDTDLSFLLVSGCCDEGWSPKFTKQELIDARAVLFKELDRLGISYIETYKLSYGMASSYRTHMNYFDGFIRLKISAHPEAGRISKEINGIPIEVVIEE